MKKTIYTNEQLRNMIGPNIEPFVSVVEDLLACREMLKSHQEAAKIAAECGCRIVGLRPEIRRVQKYLDAIDPGAASEERR